MSWNSYKNNFKKLFGFNLETENEEKCHLSFKKLNEQAVLPTYAHDGDIGMDLTAISVEYDAENDVYNYHTGLAVATDKKYGIFLYPRSSNRKTSCYLANSVAVIDSFIYRGELIICFKNRTSLSERIKLMQVQKQFDDLTKAIRNSNSLKKLQDKIKNINNTEITIDPMQFAPYEVGDRIAQMVVLPVTKTQRHLLTELNSTVRNDAGFGSTGR